MYLRAATAYGVSPRLRSDLVVNNLVGYAVTTGEVLIKSDGTPWRPLVHVEDIARAYLALVAAPRERSTIRRSTSADGRELPGPRGSGVVAETVPGARVTFAPGASPDIRNYRVSCENMARVPAYRPSWTVRRASSRSTRRTATRGSRRTSSSGSRFLRVKPVLASI